MKNVSPSNLQVLIVEPDAHYSELLTSHLSQRGIDVVSVSGPDEALELLHEKPDFHFVISELDLPQSSGWDLSLHIRDLNMTKLPEILLISDKEFVDIEMAHQSGACHMLAKPLKFDTLIKTLKYYSPRAEDKRRFDRVEVDPHVHGSMTGHLKTDYGDVQNFEVSNIGRGGLFMELSIQEIKGHELKIGQVVDFKAKLTMVPDFSIEGTGIVRWTKEGMFTVGAGIEFLQLNSDTESLIDAYVRLFRVKSFVPGKWS